MGRLSMNELTRCTIFFHGNDPLSWICRYLTMVYPVGVTAVDHRNGPSNFQNLVQLQTIGVSTIVHHLNRSVGDTLTIRQHLKSEQTTILIVRQCWESKSMIHKPSSILDATKLLSQSASKNQLHVAKTKLFGQICTISKMWISLHFPFRLLLIFII